MTLAVSDPKYKFITPGFSLAKKDKYWENNGQLSHFKDQNFNLRLHVYLPQKSRN